MARTHAAQDVCLGGTAHDVHQLDPVGQARLLQHLAKVRGGRGVDQGGVAFATHRPDHPQGRQWVDEAGGALLRRHALREHQTVHRADGPVLGVHGAPEDGHGLAQKRLGGGRAPGRDDDTRTLVPDGKGLAYAGGHGAQGGGSDGRSQHSRGSRPRNPRGADVGRPDQQAKVRGIDRRRLDANHHIVRTWRGDVHLLEGELQLSAVLDQRP